MTSRTKGSRVKDFVTNLLWRLPTADTRYRLLPDEQVLRPEV